MPGEVAVFDCNGDGRSDIFFTHGANIVTLKKDAPKYQTRLSWNEAAGAVADLAERDRRCMAGWFRFLSLK